MKRMIGCAAAGLALCTLLVALAGADGAQGMRPYRFHALGTFVIDTTTGYLAYTDSGEGTHVGPETNFATGNLDPSGIVTGRGTVTASNGDKIFYDAVGPLGGQLVVTITGGTGRFANVTGALTRWTYENVEQIQHGPLLIVRADATAEGWISY